jgi:UDP:flavonoid glycosyltransferase YjiC (YdhE family)
LKRVLFFAEAVTLAHVARPVALATTLDRARFEPILACAERYERFAAGPWQTLELDSISGKQFGTALARGSPVYDVATLRRYVRQDLELIERVKPDVIVGDFRLSLSVSARLVGIPYITVTNAYWSPHYDLGSTFPLPSLPMTRWLPLPLATALFRWAQPLAFRVHCRPLNRVRLENGLPSLGADLRRVYTDADFTAYADIPELFPIHDLPPNHGYLGPILWSPPVRKPPWWDNLPTGRPIVYVTMGSSGDAGVLATVLEGLQGLPVTVIASTAGTLIPGIVPANSHVADYLPGNEAAARAALVICNGGSLTCQQALAAGARVIGIASNMDQFLNMGGLAGAGLGLVLRADRINSDAVRAAALEALGPAAAGLSTSTLAGGCDPRELERRFTPMLDAVQAAPSRPAERSKPPLRQGHGP